MILRILIAGIALLSAVSTVSAESSGLCDGVTKEFLNTKLPFAVDEIEDKQTLKDMGLCQAVVRIRGEQVTTYTTSDKSGVLIGNLYQNKKIVAEKAVHSVNEKAFRRNEKALNNAVAFTYKPSGAKKHIYLFTDPDCPYCEKVKAEIQQWAFEKKVEVRVVLFPLPMHPAAKEKSIRGICGSMTFDQYVRAEYPGQSCKAGEDKIAASIDLARKLGVDGTPIFIGPKGKRAVGFSRESAEKILQ
ncbi:MAG TPA: DsbC family protein [Dissulfurispiraceae bacterium]|nr:DsbC family protein [Dissulfurispiraceae bacterium]